MSSDSAHPPRREFLGQLSLMALAASAPASRAPVAREPTSSTWDMSWVEPVTAAPYRVVLDANKLGEDALYFASDIMDTFHEVYSGPDTQTRVVIVARQLGVPLALTDALWDRYAIGEDRKITDPATKAPARRNTFLRAEPNAPPYEVESKIEPLVARGAIVLVCNRALMNTARSMAEKIKRNAEEVQADFKAGLVPGAYLMPNGIFGLVRAQNAGCAYLKF
jgi:intracellular sulfur oxidation DsrE/DsrF family protein